MEKICYTLFSCQESIYYVFLPESVIFLTSKRHFYTTKSILLLNKLGDRGDLLLGW